MIMVFPHYDPGRRLSFFSTLVIESSIEEESGNEILMSLKFRTLALAAMREAVLETLKVRFPGFVGEAWNAIDEIDSIRTLGKLMADFAVALDEDAARRALEAHTQQ